MAITVTSKIKQILKARDAKIIDGTEAMLSLLAELRKQIAAELATVPDASYTAFFLKQSLASVERHLADWQSAAQREIGTLLGSTFTMGAELLPEVLQTAGVSMSAPWLTSTVLDSLKEFTFGRISAVASEAYTRIQGELSLGILGQKTPQEVASAIAGNLPGRSIFKSIAERSEVITGTEMGRAFSLATQRSIEGAQDTLPALEKMWLHAGHPRAPRQVHLLLHGQVRKVGNPFYQTPEGVKVHFPRDPDAPIKEVIKCGCTHVPYMTAWGDAKTFAAEWDQTQYDLWFKNKAA